MKKFKWLQRACYALLGAALAFTPMLFGCDNGSDGDGGGKSEVVGKADAIIYKEFDDTPSIATDVAAKTLAATTLKVKIYKGETLVDEIGAGEEVYYSGGRKNANQIGELPLKKQRLVYVEGNKLYVIPHTDENAYSKLDFNTTYRVVVDDGILDGKTGVTWEFKTDAEKPISGNTIKVAQDGTGNFRTINGALNYIRGKNATGNWTVNIAKGEYMERVYYYGTANITLVGEEDNPGTYGKDVVIKWNNSQENFDSDPGTRGRAAMLVGGKGNLVMKNLTVKNLNEKAADNQAEAFTQDSSGYLVVYNCSFLSHQDTIYVGAKGNRSWFYKCYIEGNTDYLWGYADVALFEECELVCVHNGKSANATTANAILIAARGALDQKANKGFVLYNNKIVIKDSVGLSFARNSGADTNGAIVNNTFFKEGSGFILNSLYTNKTNTQAYDINKDMAIGWKDYGNKYEDGTDVNTSARYANCGDLTARVANREYNGRYVILNRGFNEKTESYEAADVWDISAFEAEFNATADSSKNNVYIEPVAIWDVVSGSDGTSVTFKGSKTGTWEATEANQGTIIKSFENGVLTTNANVEGTVTVTLTADGHTDTAYAYVIPTMIVAEKVELSDSSLTKLDLYDYAKVSAVGKTNDDVDATKKTITWTSSDPAVVKFVDGDTKAQTTVTTTKLNEEVVIYAVKAGSATITAKHKDGPEATMSITVSDDKVVWKSFIAGVEVNTDIQSGTVGAFNGMVVDTSQKKGKVGMKTSSSTRTQCRNVDLYIPVKADCDIVINLESAANHGATSNQSGIEADGTKITYTGEQVFEQQSGQTYTGPWYYTVHFDYDTQAVDYTGAVPSAGNGNASYVAGAKYAKVVFPFAKDVYWTSIEVNYKDGEGNPYNYSYVVKNVTVAFDDKAQATLDLSSTKELTRTATLGGTDASEATLTYTSSATGVATVDANGKVEAKGIGIATITAKNNVTDNEDSYEVLVKDTSAIGDEGNFDATKVLFGGSSTTADFGPIEVEGISHHLDSHGWTVAKGAKLKVKIPAGATKVTLLSCQYGNHPKATATVSDSSEVSPSEETTLPTGEGVELPFTVAAGTAERTVIFTFDNSGWVHGIKYAPYTAPTATLAEFTNAKVVVAPDGRSSFASSQTATLASGTGTITYSSSNESVATVIESTGVVTIKGPGFAKIKAVVDGNAESEKSYVIEVQPAASETYSWTSADFDAYSADGVLNTLKYDSNVVKHSAPYITINNGAVISVPVDSEKAANTKLEFYFSANDANCSGITFGNDTTAVNVSDNMVTLDSCDGKTEDVEGVTYVKCVIGVSSSAQAYLGDKNGHYAITRTVTN